MVDRLEALQTIRVGLEETCAHLTTQLFAAERRLKETEAAGAALIDPLFALGVELQRLRERVAELEEHVRKGDRFIGAVERAEKAESERDAARAEIRQLKSTGDGNEANRAWYEFGVKDGTEFTLVERDTARVERNAAQNNLKLMAEGHDIEMAEMRAERDAALAQVATLREALRGLLDALGGEFASEDEISIHDFDSSADYTRALIEVRAVHKALAALASTPAPTHDYSGLCAAPSCEGHCGYVHARGCEAVREYLADHGGEPYRAPSPPDILRRVAERARERIAALAYDAGRPDLCARVRAIDLNVLLDGGE